MKIWMTVIGSIGCATILILCSGITRAAVTNTTSSQSYEKLTDVVLLNFQQDITNLLAMQISDRALKTRLWLQLLNQIDRTRDLNFDFNDPNNQYSANVAPPHFGDSDADPATIKNSEDLRIYEEAILQNHIKTVKFNFELQLKNWTIVAQILQCNISNQSILKHLAT